MFFGCRLMWSSNHLYTTLCNHQNQQQLLRPGSRSLDVIDLGDKGSGVSLFTLYCTVLCIHSINIMLQPSLLLAGRRKEWPCFLSLSSTWFKSNFFAHSVLSCMISHNQLVFSASPSYVRKVNICPTHLSNVDRSGGVGLGGSACVSCRVNGLFLLMLRNILHDFVLSGWLCREPPQLKFTIWVCENENLQNF